MTITHGECGKSWTGPTRAHCGACHETFNSESLADKHRKGPFPGRHCDTAGMRQDEAGIWRAIRDDMPTWADR